MCRSFSIFLTILSAQIFAQNTLDVSWSKEVESSLGQVEGWGISVDDNNDIFWSVSNNERGQGLDIECFKFDKDGVPLWEAPFLFDGGGIQQSYVVNTDHNYIYIGGRSCTGLINTCDMLLLQVEKESGVLKWNRTLNFAADGYDEIDGLELKDDGIYCGGWAQQLQSGPFQSDIGLWKLDYDGNTIWTNYLGQENSAEHQDGHFVVDEDGIYVAGLWNGRGAANLYNGHSFLGRFSREDGTLIDSILFGPQSESFLDIENALGMTSDGTHLYVTGYSTPVSANDWQIYIAKFDKSLNQIWYIDWGGSGTETARAISVKDDFIYVAGLTESEEIIGTDKRDGVLLKLDTDGNNLQSYIWGDNDIQTFHDISVTESDVFITGTTEVGQEGGEKRAFLIASLGIVTSLDDALNNSPPTFDLVPNPSFGSFQIRFNQVPEKDVVVSIYDVNGILHDRRTSLNQELNLERLPEGVYIINVNFGNFTMNRKWINLR